MFHVERCCQIAPNAKGIGGSLIIINSKQNPTQWVCFEKEERRKERAIAHSVIVRDMKSATTRFHVKHSFYLGIRMVRQMASSVS